VSVDENAFEHGMTEVQLHYVQAGAGSRILVLLHGYPEMWWQWRHTMAPLCDGWTRGDCSRLSCRRSQRTVLSR